MADAVPCVYILNGEDDYAIEQALAEMLAGLGDPATAEMNTTRLDGTTYNPEQLLTVAGAMPFLARRRLVILTNPLAKLNSEPARKKFREQLEQVPPTTALVLVQNKLLTSAKDRRDNKPHWLERWAEKRNTEEKHRGSVLVKTFFAPDAHELAERMVKFTRKAGGRISQDAALQLVELTGGSQHIAALEVEKLLAYVNYSRTIEIDDVQAVTADNNQGDVFNLVDALATGDGKQAIEMLLRQKERRSYYEIFGMIVRQFRLLILTREIIEAGGGVNQIQSGLKSYNIYRKSAENLEKQARRFSMAVLEDAYRRLVQVDEAVKTSQAPDDLVLEYFITAFIKAPEQSLT